MSESATAIPILGIRLGVACAGIKYANRRDLVLLEVAPGTSCAAVFTRNAFCAAPVTVAKQNLSITAPRYLVINTGNANAGTGQQGLDAAAATCSAVAAIGSCRAEEVLPFSTGVIGEPFPIDRLSAALPGAFAGLSEAGWNDAAWGIMTTDTRPKLVSRQLSSPGGPITITGIAKGAGMIKPDMATMLAFIATDAELQRPLLQNCLENAVAGSFNAITVDGDTSTNDACVLLATGQSDIRIQEEDALYPAFVEILQDLCVELAQALIRDGEGATKFITICVEQGHDASECRQVAYTVAHSPLIKTAFFASDPNWGRILAAVGRSGLDQLSLERIIVYLDEVCIVRNGGRSSDYNEALGQAVMKRTDITIRIQLGRGTAAAKIWTTDLSHDYIRINAEYRT